MKKYVLLGLIIAILLTIAVFLSVVADKDEVELNIESTAISSVYIIKELNGNVAVYHYGSDSPFQILDCKIKNLPPDAREALVTGIKVSGDEELQKLIEAYD